MEGIGYWFFLAALYLLSALLKKRQQKAAKRKMDNEEDNKKDWTPPDFLQNVFSEFKERRDELFSEEAETPEWAEGFSADLGENVEIEAEKKEDLETAETISPVKKESDKISHKANLSERLHTAADYQIQRKENPYYNIFQNLDQVRQAIILKEILGRPRALNRGIRN